MPIGTVIGEEGQPIEVGPGFGDLRYSATGLSIVERFVSLVNRHVSYASIFATQPLVAGVAGWLLRQSLRVPLKAYEGTSDDDRRRLEPGADALADLITDPWEGGSPTDLVLSMLGSLLVHGNKVMEVDQGARNRVRFQDADWRFVNPIVPWRDTIAGWELDIDIAERRRARGAQQVLHLRCWSPLGPLGLSPLSQLGVTIKLEDAATRSQSGMMANGIRTATAVKTTDDRFFGIKPDERAELMGNLRRDIAEGENAGPDHAGAPWVLPPGLEVQTIGQTAQEAMLIEQRHVNRSEALGLFGVLPGAYGQLGERTSELGEQWTVSITGGLAPPLILIEQAINAQIVRRAMGEKDKFVEFDFAGILRGDKLKEIEALRQAISSALMKPNEGRGVLNLPKSDEDGMDSFYLPRNNLIPLGVPYSATGNREGESPGPETPAPDGPGKTNPRYEQSDSGLLVPA